MNVENDGFILHYFSPDETLAPVKEYCDELFDDDWNKLPQPSDDLGDFFAEITSIKNKQSTPLSQLTKKKVKTNHSYPKTVEKANELGEKCIIRKCDVIDQDGSFQDGRCANHYLLRERKRAGMKKTHKHQTSISPEVIKFLKERSKVSETQKDVSDIVDASIYRFRSNTPPPSTDLEDINLNESNFSSYKDCSDSFEVTDSDPYNDLNRRRESGFLSPLEPFDTFETDAFETTDSDPLNDLNRIRESDFLSPLKPFDPFETDAFEATDSDLFNDLNRIRESDTFSPPETSITGTFLLNIENLVDLQDVISDPVSSSLEATIGKVETIKLTCLNPNCKKPLSKKFNKEENLCNRCWIFKNKNGEFPTYSRTRRRTPIEKSVQKMKAANIVCKNTYCKDPEPREFRHSQGLCGRC